MLQYIEFLGSEKICIPCGRRQILNLYGREAFGRVTVEAMMSSNPVIASDTGANPELIMSGKNGLLFKEGNASFLADQMFGTENTSKVRIYKNNNAIYE